MTTLASRTLRLCIITRERASERGLSLSPPPRGSLLLPSVVQVEGCHYPSPSGSLTAAAPPFFISDFERTVLDTFPAASYHCVRADPSCWQPLQHPSRRRPSCRRPSFDKESILRFMTCIPCGPKPTPEVLQPAQCLLHTIMRPSWSRRSTRWRPSAKRRLPAFHFEILSLPSHLQPLHRPPRCYLILQPYLIRLFNIFTSTRVSTQCVPPSDRRTLNWTFPGSFAGHTLHMSVELSTTARTAAALLIADVNSVLCARKILATFSASVR